ncbi:MAG: PDZ domain-containing protein, partial [Bacteroidaceae bacterium]|nr:PDZ domain-containing protein [Bacteroidaceae bacterium]
VVDGGGAIAAGLKKGDIITEINGKKIKTMAELQETIAQYSPGDKVSVSYIRDKKSKSANVTLMNSRGNTEVVKDAGIDVLGAAFKPVDDQTKRQLNIGYGVQVSGVSAGKMQKAGIQRGFIILKINNSQIKDQQDVENAFQEASKSAEQVMFISGIYPSGRRANYAVDLSDE